MGGAWIMAQHILDEKSRSDLRNLRELRGNRHVAQLSLTHRFALYSRIGVVLMPQLESSWHGKSSNTSVRVVFANRSGFDAPIGVVLAREERGSCLSIFKMTNRGWISETFTNYEAKDMLRKSVDHVSTYSGRQIAVGSQKPSRITRQQTCCASVSNTSVRVVFASRSGFDAPIGVVLAWEEPRSCLNIFRTTNPCRISETFTNYEAKDLLRAWIMSQNIPDDKSRSDLINLLESRGKRLVAHGRGSCLNIFRTTNRGRISETFTNYEAKDLLRKSVDHVSTYSGRQIAVGSQKPLRIMRQNTCCSRAWIMSQHIPDDKSWSDLINLHELRGKRLVAQVSQTGRFALYLRTGVVLMVQLESSWQRRSVDHLSTYFGRQIPVESQKPSRITRQKSCCALESNTSVRVVFANRRGFDAPIGVVLAWEERGSCLNLFWTTNRGWISETFANYEAKHLLRNRLGVGGAWILSQRIPDDKSLSDLRNLHELRGKRLVAQVSQTRRFELYSRTGVVLMLKLGSSWHGMSIRVVFANRSGFDAPIGVVLAWDERGSCLIIFRTKNHGRIIETFTNYEAKGLLRNRLCMGGAWIMSQHIPDDKSWWDLRNLHELRAKRLVANLHELRSKRLFAQVSQTRRFELYSRTGVVLILQLESSWHGRSVDHVSTYSGRQIAFGSQKPSRITKQKTFCASESNTSVRIVFSNRSGFDAPIGVVLPWKEHGSCLNIFRTKNCVGSQKPSQMTRQKTCCASESNMSVRVPEWF
ncbi:uncharacterized protein G2W53_033673 [Senna tora]|uniref:Uncharacterized protein n=1 Tax=Senna tora TaxID=362788 RepID=A0A834T0I8_9FABA|nr:uncharacterized protein G2W53_033673 [Senna tora]